MLALAQSRWIKDRIEKEHKSVGVELVRIKTKGDKIIDSPLSRIGGKGLFVKEIEDALLRNNVDLAVIEKDEEQIHMMEADDIYIYLATLPKKSIYIRRGLKEQPALLPHLQKTQIMYF